MNTAPHTGNPTSTTTASATASADTSAHLRRLRWAVRATLTLGVAASVAANVLHAQSNPISQIIAAWPPLALLLTVELISRVPHHRRSLGTIRIIATAIIAAIATWVSYWHLVGVATRYGETEAAAAYLLPISVDGLVIVASVSLVELTARIRAATPDQQPALIASPEFPPATEPTHVPRQPSAQPGTLAPQQRAAGAEAAPARTRTRRPIKANQRSANPQPLDRLDDAQRVDPPPRRPDKEPRTETDTAEGAVSDGGPVPPETASAVAYWYRREPNLHPAEIAARIGRSERTVRRYWPPPATRHPSPATTSPT
ncbi:DUF2637 domain-containing protein [Micromonospora sp. NPDC005161]